MFHVEHRLEVEIYIRSNLVPLHEAVYRSQRLVLDSTSYRLEFISHHKMFG